MNDDDNDDSEVPNPGSLIHSAWVKGEFIKTLQKNRMGRCIVWAPLWTKIPSKQFLQMLSGQH